MDVLTLSVQPSVPGMVAKLGREVEAINDLSSWRRGDALILERGNGWLILAMEDVIHRDEDCESEDDEDDCHG
jgi:hypothetical protein